MSSSATEPSSDVSRHHHYHPTERDTTTTSSPQIVVIVGAGIMGLATAYYLLENHSLPCILIDRSGRIAPGASSKAAGFLARDWNDGSPLQDLTHRSFHLHQQVADKFGHQRIQYRRLFCTAVTTTTKQEQQSSPKKKSRKSSTTTSLLQWAQPVPTIREIQSMGDTDSIAQVHPHLLCQALWEHIHARGCVLRKGRVIGAVHHGDGTLIGAQLASNDHSNNNEMIPATHLLYAAGPWNANIMKGIKGHSVVAPTHETLSEAVFFYEDDDNDTSCEVFVRPDATAFCTGEPNDPVATMNVEPGQEEVEQDKANKLQQSIRYFTGWSKLKDDDTIVNACYQPVTDDFLPVLGELSMRAAGGSNCYMAGGLNCWGILLSLAAGEAMADLIVTGRSKTVSLQAFRPSRFRNLKPVPT